MYIAVYRQKQTRKKKQSNHMKRTHLLRQLQSYDVATNPIAVAVAADEIHAFENI